MRKILVISSGDWADEFDLEGFAIFEQEEWEKIKAGIPDKPFEAYFGSNEFVTFDDKDDYLSHITEKVITEADEAILRSLLNMHKSQKEYGLFVVSSENY